jgi:hypothetical protein
MKDEIYPIFHDPCQILDHIKESEGPLIALTKGSDDNMVECTIENLENPEDFNTKIQI